MTSDGIYLIESDNKLILTDGDYDDPKIYLVAVIESKYNDVIQFVKEFIYDEYEAWDQTDYAEPLRLAQSTFQNANVIFRESRFSQADGRWNERQGVRGNRGELDRKAEKNEVNQPGDAVRYSASDASDETKSTEQLRIEELSRLVADYDRASEAARKTLDEQMKRGPKQIAKDARRTREKAEENPSVGVRWYGKTDFPQEVKTLAKQDFSALALKCIVVFAVSSEKRKPLFPEIRFDGFRGA